MEQNREMKIIVKRESGRAEAARATRSVVEVRNDDGAMLTAFCGLEPDFDEVKEAGGSRIPGGTYKVGVRQEGAMTTQYFMRFGWFRGMLHVQDVPNYKYIYIHIGNYAQDTQGCLLVGIGFNGDTVTQSVSAFRELYQLVIADAVAGQLEIEYIDTEAEAA